MARTAGAASSPAAPGSTSPAARSSESPSASRQGPAHQASHRRGGQQLQIGDFCHPWGSQPLPVSTSPRAFCEKKPPEASFNFAAPPPTEVAKWRQRHPAARRQSLRQQRPAARPQQRAAAFRRQRAVRDQRIRPAIAEAGSSSATTCQHFSLSTPGHYAKKSRQKPASILLRRRQQKWRSGASSTQRHDRFE